MLHESRAQILLFLHVINCNSPSFGIPDSDIEIELEGSVEIVLPLIDIGRIQGGFENGSAGVEVDFLSALVEIRAPFQHIDVSIHDKEVVVKIQR